MIPSLISNPAGSVQCDACKSWAHPTVTVDERDDLPFTACEACCDQLTPYAIRAAIEASRTGSKVEARDEMIAEHIDQHSEQGKLFATRPVSQEHKRRRVQRAA